MHLPCIHFLPEVTGDMKNCNSRMCFNAFPEDFWKGGQFLGGFHLPQTQKTLGALVMGRVGIFNLLF